MDTVFVLTSITYSAKAQALLKQHGIPSELTRSLNVRQIRGCGYGLKVNSIDKEEAEKLMKNNGIKIAGVTVEQSL